MVTRIGHFAIRAKDMEKTAAFYREVVGLEEAFRMYNEDGGASSIHMFVAPSQYIEIFPDGTEVTNANERSIGHSHVCLEVDDIETAFRDMTGKGTPIDSEVKKGFSGCLQFWTHDPDGNSIEFMELPPDCLQLQANKRLASSSQSASL